MTTTREELQNLKHYLDAGQEIELCFPLYQYWINLKRDFTKNLIHITTNHDKTWTHIYGKENFTEVVKDQYVSEIIDYYINDTNTLTKESYSGVKIFKPTLLDIASTRFKDIIKTYTMPKLSEKARINSAGEVELIVKSKKENRYNFIYDKTSTLTPKEKKEVYRQKYYADLEAKHEKQKAYKLAHACPFKASVMKKPTLHERSVCIKHTNGNIFRMTAASAVEIMEKNPNMYKYCTKSEWKTQKQFGDSKVFNIESLPKSVQLTIQSNRIANVMRNEKKEKKDKWKRNSRVIPIIRKQIPKIKKEQVSSVRFDFYTDKDLMTPFKSITKYCVLGQDSKSNPGTIVKRLEKKFYKKYKSGKIMFSIIDTKYFKTIKEEVIKPKLKVEKTTKTLMNKKLVIEKTKVEKDSIVTYEIHRYFTNEKPKEIGWIGDTKIDTSKLTTFKVIRKKNPIINLEKIRNKNKFKRKRSIKGQYHHKK